MSSGKCIHRRRRMCDIVYYYYIILSYFCIVLLSFTRGENAIVSWTVRCSEHRHDNKGPLNPTYSCGRLLNVVRDRHLLTSYWPCLLGERSGKKRRWRDNEKLLLNEKIREYTFVLRNNEKYNNDIM